jgi:hypothetical protein
MSSEDQDLASLVPFSLPSLSPPDGLPSLPPSLLRGGSQHDNGSQQGLSQSQLFSDFQFDSMGASVGLQLPAPPDLVIPQGSSLPGIQTGPVAPMLGRLPTQAVQMFPNHAYMWDPAAAMLTAPVRHPSVCKAEHKNSKAARRGPMDEMRQLVRILVKLMPESSRFLTVPDEGGGGNRVKEEHIKDYLNKVLGRSQDSRDDTPPYPDWGLVNGWAAYLSGRARACSACCARRTLTVF